MSVDLGSAYGKIEIDASGVQDGVKKAQGALSGFQSKAGAALGTVARVGAVAFAAVGAAAVAGFGLAMRSAIDMNATLETSTLQFETLMGDADKAKEHVAGLFEFAEKTPFETGPIIDASLKLQTFGGEALNTMENLTLIGDASAAVSAPINELGFWVGRLYSNLQAGAPFGEAAMRLQELAVMSPEARAEMEALQEAGASADEIFAYFQEDLGKFTGAMEKQAGTWQGLTSTIKDQLSIMTATALKPFFDLMKQGLAGIVEWLNNPEMQAAIASFADRLATIAAVMIAWITNTLVPFIQEHGPAIIQVIKTLAAVFGALFVVSQVVGLITGLIGVVTAASAAFTLAGGGIAGVVALLGGPVTLVIAAVMGLIALFTAAWVNNWGDIQGKTQAVLDFIRPFIETTIQGIRTFIETTLAAIRAFWEEHGQGILDFTSRIWDAIKAAIDGFLRSIMLIFQAFKQLFAGDWEALGETLKELWQNAWDTIIEVLSNIWAAFAPILTNLWESIKGWWQSVDWGSLGRNLIDGVVRGIRNAGGAIRDTLMDMARQAWEAVKAFFGIQSPSKLMTWAGEMIGEGLIVGVRSKQSDAARAMRRMSNIVGSEAVTSQLLNTMRSMRATGVAYNTTNQPFTVYGGLYLQRDSQYGDYIKETYGISR